MTKKKSLNYLRYHYFLDPAGINREIFEKVNHYVLTSLLDWYLLGKEESERSIDTECFTFALRPKSEEDIEEIFSRRKDLIKKCKDAVPKEFSKKKPLRQYTESVFPEQDQDLSQVIVDLDSNTNPSIRFNQNFNGEMHPHDNIVAFAAGLISKFLNPNLIARCVSPSIAEMEKTVAGWLADLVGYTNQEYTVLPKDILTESEKIVQNLLPRGNIVNGGTIANLTALLVARNKLLKEKISLQEAVGTAEKGLFSYCQKKELGGAVVICSENAHYSIEKLGGYIGIGTENVLKAECDEGGKMKISSIKEKIEQAKKNGKKVLAIVATAGTTACGAIDPLDEIADITETEGIYFHVDAAHGGGFLVSKEMRQKFKGIERADSVTIDGHKMFYTNYPCGGIVFKDKMDPLRYLKQSADYILDKPWEHYNAGKSTLEGSRSADGVLQLYATIKALGREGLETLVNYTADMTKCLAKLVDQSEVLEKLNEPEMNLLCFRYIPRGWDRIKGASQIDALNSMIDELVYQDGEYYIGSTKMRIGQRTGCAAQKAVIMHPYVEKETIEGLVKKIEEIGGVLAESWGKANEY